jgi:hypothetical protein
VQIPFADLFYDLAQPVAMTEPGSRIVIAVVTAGPRRVMTLCRLILDHPRSQTAPMGSIVHSSFMMLSVIVPAAAPDMTPATASVP